MSHFRDRPFARLALIGALAATFALAGCGRKGPLDPPPGASLAGEPQPDMPGLMSSSGAPAKPRDAGIGPDGQPTAPKGQSKHIPLDVLLN